MNVRGSRPACLFWLAAFVWAVCLQGGAFAADRNAPALSARKVEAVSPGKTIAVKDERTMRITLNADGKSIVFELNDSQAAKDLYAQLPLSVDVEDYGGKEKIYYPPKKLKTSNTPLVRAAHPGTLAYYAPWGDVVMFHGSFGSAAGLYELGRAVQGAERIRTLPNARIQLDRMP